VEWLEEEYEYRDRSFTFATKFSTNGMAGNGPFVFWNKNLPGRLVYWATLERDPAR
jgi:hypothetical protein